MTRCATCGNDYDQTFRVLTRNGHTFDFDSIECAAAKIAPCCAKCGVKVLGHGVHLGLATFCCSACARASGLRDATDRLTVVDLERETGAASR